MANLAAAPDKFSMTHASSSHWQFWIDVGGTFTDVIARTPQGETRRMKLLSSGWMRGRIERITGQDSFFDARRSEEPAGFWNGARLALLGRDLERRVAGFDAERGLLLDAPLPEDAAGAEYELSAGVDAPVLAIRLLTGTKPGEKPPACRVRLGTTRGTNALLTRNGAKTVLVTTRGFGDLLEIGDQQRPRLFELGIQKAKPLAWRVIEAQERVTASGEVERPLDEAALRKELAAAKAEGAESVAICLLNAYAQGSHELRAAELAREAGFEFVSISHQIAPQIKLVARAETTLLDAYLRPVLQDYLARIEAELGEDSLLLMTSSGGLVSAAAFSGADSLLSGPAGGVVGFARAARAAGFERAIGFDMGGTSTDVARNDGAPDLQFESVKAGVRVLAPMLAIETVAAGGGSICSYDGVALQVGPQSAGADPGPACYGKGGPLTVTDLNIFTGRLREEDFPFTIDRAAVQRRLEELARQRGDEAKDPLALAKLAEGLLRIANQKMGLAIASVSTSQGYDPRRYLLVAFGGAAGQHACAVAEEVGATQVLLHPDASLLSALGCGLAEEQHFQSVGVYELLSDEAIARREEHFATLEEAARSEFPLALRKDAIVERFWELRYAGAEATFLIPDEPQRLREEFERLHQARFGYLHPGRALEVVSLRVQARSAAEFTLPPSRRLEADAPPKSSGEQQVFLHGAWIAAPVYRETELKPGDAFSGPALVVAEHTTLFLAPGWALEMLSGRELLLTRKGTSEVKRVEESGVAMELLANALTGAAERMGRLLRNTAGSVNVKERLDFSCALFTASGDLIVNAPHVPVHLGGMSATVKRLIASEPNIAPGDVFITNDPYCGGSHLPDVTVMTPIFLPGETKPRFFAANRAHHAEIGGVTPGSMPPFSTRLGEEGVLLPLMRLVAGGESRLEEARKQLLSASYPTRSVEENLRDIEAQIAANRLGAEEVRAICAREGVEQVEEAIAQLFAATARKLRTALEARGEFSRTFADALDDGTPIVVRVEAKGGRIRFDFTGSGPVSPHNLNANPAIVSAAVLYALRCFLNEPIPLNQGLLEPVELVIPEGVLSPPDDAAPEQRPAVVGGNVETSQRVVDVLLAALGLAAASQGTMNNVLLGDATFGYYETICGGEGATPESDGASAVHTHMTNTRITDPEVVERRIPARVEEFSVRRGSGGAGKRRGGDGVVRRLRFARPLTLSILSQRRARRPFGLEGGEPGEAGVNELHRASGIVEILQGRALREVGLGDELVIRTPGGGGYGRPEGA